MINKRYLAYILAAVAGLGALYGRQIYRRASCAGAQPVLPVLDFAYMASTDQEIAKYIGEQSQQYDDLIKLYPLGLYLVSPLIGAAFAGDYDSIQRLAPEKVDTNGRNASYTAAETPTAGHSALQGALYAHCYECVEFLLRAGVDIHHPFDGNIVVTKEHDRMLNRRNTYALLYAISRKLDAKFIQLLIDHGAVVTVNTHGLLAFTPLSLAILVDRPDIFSILLKAGADPDTLNADGLSARDYAQLSCNTQFRKLLSSS